MRESDLERELNRRGQELMRKLLQGHLDQRSPGEAAGPVEGADGVERSERRLHDRQLETTFGTVAFDEALFELSRHSGAQVPKRQAEQLVARAAEDFDVYERRRASRSGCGAHLRRLVLHHEDARGDAQGGREAPAATRAARNRLRPGEKKPPNAWRRWPPSTSPFPAEPPRSKNRACAAN